MFNVYENDKPLGLLTTEEANVLLSEGPWKFYWEGVWSYWDKSIWDTNLVYRKVRPVVVPLSLEQPLINCIPYEYRYAAKSVSSVVMLWREKPDWVFDKHMSAWRGKWGDTAIRLPREMLGVTWGNVDFKNSLIKFR